MAKNEDQDVAIARLEERVKFLELIVYAVIGSLVAAAVTFAMNR